MKLRYFAWIREKIGCDAEEIILPQNVETVADLLSFLKMRGENYAMALEQQDLIHVAIDYEHATLFDQLHNAQEIALFPPMTGG